MKISVIIPTLNEEKNLPLLLESLKEQTFKDFEILVADAGSTDKTRILAKEAGAKVIDGGMPGPGRNAGARASIGEFLIFLDADVKVDPTFLEEVYQEMDEEFLDLATCRFVPLSNIRLDKLIHRLINLEIQMTRKTNPKTFGFGIFCSRRLFNKINGFDETITLAEDCDFVSRGAKYRPMAYLEKPRIYVSVRRFEKEGRLNYAKKGIDIWLHRWLKGEIRDDSIEYEFARFDTVKKDDTTTLDKIEKVLLDMERQFSDFKSGKMFNGKVMNRNDFEIFMKQEMNLARNNFNRMFKRKK